MYVEFLELLHGVARRSHGGIMFAKVHKLKFLI